MNLPSPTAGSSKLTTQGNLWSEILSEADRQKGLKRKNVLLLSEKHRGRRFLLDKLSSTISNKHKPRKVSKTTALALGYEVLEMRDEGDEESAPPLSVFYPPSSAENLLKLVPASLPPNSLQDTAVVILLDWTKPSLMVRELLTWLAWIDKWVESSTEQGEAEEMRDRLQSHLQHYSEPATSTSSGLAAYGAGPLLPLGPGTLTLNQHGIPIVVVCTKADLMDTVGDEIGMKGAGWEERTDWIQQVLRTLCLAYGAALFYTAPTQPQTYTLLRTYLLHRLYTTPPSLHSPTESNTPAPISRFPFPHRANVLDRDAVMVPSGWDSWGKINVLREGFDPARVAKAWEVGLNRAAEVAKGETKEVEDGEEEDVEDLWEGMIPDTERGPKPSTNTSITTTVEPEQNFLSRQLDLLMRDPNRLDPRQQFRSALTASASTETVGPNLTSSSSGGTFSGMGGVVGPMGNGGLNLPGVEKVINEMGGSAEDLKEKFARLGRKDSTRPGGPLSPGATPGAVPNEALHNFFQGLLATKGKTATPSKTPSPAPPTE
ncbi:hypothetical protein M231_00245 [Tremella mesenterica]|uniref:Dynein light intermediate chain 1, cytosolic n=1 Tax=Tremella mesenterica TaxID=5217 RepID=A0A4Q1BWX1_TREME|nr:hypothetical protein M231_00245 [Tremella mesenterica]